MPYFSMWLNYAITLAVFPSVCQLIESGCESDSNYCKNIGKNKELFSAIFTFVMFNFCDWLGRFLAGVVQIFKPSQQFLIMVCVFLRLVPTVLLMFGNVYGKGGLIGLGSDVAYVIIMVVFGVTNGYFASLPNQHVPLLVDSTDIATACGLVPLFLTFGCLCGSGFSFAAVAIVQLMYN